MCVGAPWERVAIDVTGPHPQSKKGNKFMVTVLDHFTKYAFALPAPAHDAVTVAKWNAFSWCMECPCNSYRTEVQSSREP